MYRDIETELRYHLDTNDKLIWAGQPQRGVVFRNVDIFLIPFSIMWCGFAIFWLIGAISMKVPLFFCLFGVPFVIIGLVFVFGRFIIGSWLKTVVFVRIPYNSQI